jgi:UDP-2-acetamido-3-amino-2,3-dideoxy-glucuronate N-acetyltransferase
MTGIDPRAIIHPTAVVEEPCSIGAHTRIWHFCHVMSGAKIGDNCVLGHNVFVGEDVVIGNGVKIQNNVSVFSGVTLEDNVFVGPGAVFTNVRHPRAFVSRRHAFASTRVKRGASIGANAAILCGIAIGEYAMIGAGAVVTRDVDAHALMTGNPARRSGRVCICGETLNSTDTCAACQRRFSP